MDFEKICMMFTMQEPYYGILLSSMQRTAVPEALCDTLAVCRSGNVFRLIYNPNFINRFPIDTVLGLLKHECLHLALNHFTIWDGQEIHDDEATARLRNIACDLEANCYLDRSKMVKDAGGCWCEDMGFDPYQGSREYFRLLRSQMEKKQQEAQAQSPTQPCNGGQGGQEGQPQNNQQQPQTNNSNNQSSASSSSHTTQSSQRDSSSQGSSAVQKATQEFLDSLKSFDEHKDWPNETTEEEKEMLKQIIDDMLVFAADEVEKGQGTVPGELAGKIKALRAKKPRPVADWKRYFRRYLGNEFSEFIRKSKKRESRRFPDAAGNRHRKKSHILVAIDTSGSVSMPEYQEFFGQIKTLCPVADFHVLECDATIQYEYEYRGKPNMTLHGGGGTSFQPPVDYYHAHRKDYDALVYFTDGYAYIPKDTPKDTLWVISSQGDQDRSKYKVNGASVVFIKPKQ